MLHRLNFSSLDLLLKLLFSFTDLLRLCTASALLCVDSPSLAITQVLPKELFALVPLSPPRPKGADQPRGG